MPTKPLDLYFLFMGRPQGMFIEEMYIPDRHLHKEIECIFIQEGSLQIQVDEHIFTIRAGEMLVIGSNVLHEFKPKGTKDRIVKLKFLKEWLLPPYANDEERVQYNDLFSHSFKTQPDSYLSHLIDQMMENPLGDQYDFYLYSKMLEFAAFLMARPNVVTEKLESNLEYPHYLDEITCYIHEHFNEKLSLRMLADHLGLTESYCSRYIKKHTGLSFVEYLNAIRVNCAQRLLSYTDSNITEIIDATGFFSVQTFNRVFKNQTGKTPTEYRKVRRSNEKPAPKVAVTVLVHQTAAIASRTLRRRNDELILD